MRSTIFALLLFSFMSFFASTSFASQSIIRDTEIEDLIDAYANPIFEVAGLDEDSVNIFLINSPTINAFVAGGNNIFLYTGLISEAETPLELVSVIAHETAHITGGHLIRFSETIEKAQSNALLSFLLGGLVAVGSGQAEGGIVASTAVQSVLERSLLAHSRVHENSADQASFQFLEDAGYKLDGAVSFFERLYNNEGSSARDANEYRRTHPLTKDRIIAAKEQLKHSSGQDDLSSFQEAHDRIRAKIFAYTYPKQVRFLYSDDTIIDGYARAVSYYRLDKMDLFEQEIDALLEKEPDNPYFLELKGQAFFEKGVLDKGLPSLEKAVMIAPDAPLIRTLYAHALLETGETPMVKQSVTHLLTALGQEPGSAFRHRLLSLAYGHLDKIEHAKLHQAERAFLRRDRKELDRLLKLLEESFEEGSREWLRVQDLQNFVNLNKK